uniref:Uncharacterized protein n=1 Tax=Panagrolaimus sp. JU765 TaxID=591449 RepID=A0AC34PU97_9BILA
MNYQRQTKDTGRIPEFDIFDQINMTRENHERTFSWKLRKRSFDAELETETSQRGMNLPILPVRGCSMTPSTVVASRFRPFFPTRKFISQFQH